tara:strand:+ start:70 stop:321 length:252 start_codon:yes stop_codon:yes gene_type:complete
MCNTSITGEESFRTHLEAQHHIPIVRKVFDGDVVRPETDEECLQRFYADYPRAGGADCRCPSCRVEEDLHNFVLWAAVGLSQN